MIVKGKVKLNMFNFWKDQSASSRQRHFKAPYTVKIFISLLAISLFLFWQNLSTLSASHVDPLQTSVHELYHEPHRFDGHRVSFTGLVRSIEFQRGPMGGEYLKFVVKEAGSHHSNSIATVNVILSIFPPIQVGQYVSVQGTYHHEGKWAGRYYKFFIDAERIQKEQAL